MNIPIHVFNVLMDLATAFVGLFVTYQGTRSWRGYWEKNVLGGGLLPLDFNNPALRCTRQAFLFASLTFLGVIVWLSHMVMDSGLRAEVGSTISGEVATVMGLNHAPMFELSNGCRVELFRRSIRSLILPELFAFEADAASPALDLLHQHARAIAANNSIVDRRPLLGRDDVWFTPEPESDVAVRYHSDHAIFTFKAYQVELQSTVGGESAYNLTDYCNIHQGWLDGGTKHLGASRSLTRPIGSYADAKGVRESELVKESYYVTLGYSSPYCNPEPCGGDSFLPDILPVCNCLLRHGKVNDTYIGALDGPIIEKSDMIISLYESLISGSLFWVNEDEAQFLAGVEGPTCQNILREGAGIREVVVTGECLILAGASCAGYYNASSCWHGIGLQIVVLPDGDGYNEALLLRLGLAVRTLFWLSPMAVGSEGQVENFAKALALARYHLNPPSTIQVMDSEVVVVLRPSFAAGAAVIVMLVILTLMAHALVWFTRREKLWLPTTPNDGYIMCLRDIGDCRFGTCNEAYNGEPLTAGIVCDFGKKDHFGRTSVASAYRKPLAGHVVHNDEDKHQPIVPIFDGGSALEKDPGHRESGFSRLRQK